MLLLHLNKVIWPPLEIKIFLLSPLLASEGVI